MTAVSLYSSFTFHLIACFFFFPLDIWRRFQCVIVSGQSSAFFETAE